MHRAEIRNAHLKARFDARSRHRAEAHSQPMQFTSMKPWWELNAMRREREQAAQRPILQPMQRQRIQPVMPAPSMLARARRLFGQIVSPAYA